MKNSVKIALVSLCAILLVSCSDDFLKRDPYGDTITQEQYNQTANQLEGSMRGIYSILTSYIYTGDGHDEFGRRSLDMYTDLLSGDMALTDNKYGWFYSDERGLGNTERTGFIWTYFYSMLRNVNSILRTVKSNPDNVVNRIATNGLPNEYNSKKDVYYNIVAGDTLATYTADEAQVACYYAQALAFRGYIYSELLMLYCQTPRHINSFKQERCFPMYNEDNMESAQPLATMAEVYTQLEGDLINAIDYFEAFSEYKRNSKIEVDAAIANGILAYSYLNKGNPTQPGVSEYTEAYTNARDYALKAIQAANENGIHILPNNSLTTTGFNDVSNESWMWGENVTVETTSMLNSWWGQCDIHSYSYAWLGDTKAIDENLYKLIAAADSTKDGKPNGHPFDARILWFNDGSGNPIYKLCADGKYYSAKNPTSTKADDIDREWLSDNVLMRIEMMYLIAAEASYRLGNTNDAITYLTDITSKRVLTGHEAQYADYETSLSNGTANLLDEIEYNWRVELWGEGYSLMTFRRLSPDVTLERKRGANHKSSPGSKITEDDKYIFVMPSNEGSYNPNVNE